MIRVISSEAAAEFLTRRPVRLSQAAATVRPIIDDVRAHGDEAVLRYARKLDGYDRASPLVPDAELSAAEEQLDPALRAAILNAAELVVSAGYSPSVRSSPVAYRGRSARAS